MKHSAQQTPSELWVLVTDVTKVLQPGAVHLTSAALGENVDVFHEKSVDPVFNTCSFIVSYNMELSITAVESEAAPVSASMTGGRRRYVCLRIDSLIGGHIAQLGDFSSLACTAWQTGGVAPFFPLQAAVSQL